MEAGTPAHTEPRIISRIRGVEGIEIELVVPTGIIPVHEIVIKPRPTGTVGRFHPEVAIADIFIIRSFIHGNITTGFPSG